MTPDRATPQLNSPEMGSSGPGGGAGVEGKLPGPTSIIGCPVCAGKGVVRCSPVGALVGLWDPCPSCAAMVGPGPHLRARVNLALSLLNHREASDHTIDMAIRALHGATLEELIAVEAGG